jgi:hypothetical protein
VRVKMQKLAGKKLLAEYDNEAYKATLMLEIQP